MNAPARDERLEALLEHLRTERGFDFTGYKRATLSRRIEKRMHDVRVEHYGDYLDYLQTHPEEFGPLFNTILINVTGFFRDREAWDYLAAEVVPRLVASLDGKGPLRVWSAGCSSGEEAYSIAMVLAEALGAEAFAHRVKVYATDADEEALAQARYGHYPEKAVEAVPEPLREKYFTRNGDAYVFRSDLRRQIIFGRLDLVQDAPISRLDLLLCRNALMYFNAETQARILARFHFSLRPTGVLFLGKAEMLLTHAHLFQPIHFKHRLFGKVDRPGLRERMQVLAEAGTQEAAERVERDLRLLEGAFDAAPVAQIVLDPHGRLVAANARARTAFDLDPRDVGRPLKDLELSYRPAELRAPLDEAMQRRQPVALPEVRRRRPGEQEQYFEVQVVPLFRDGGAPIGASVLFQDVTRYKELQAELESSKATLETAYEELQSTNEEMETTNEELQSTVEELETTNEELETMNEELQSTNEELETMNEELRLRTEESFQLSAFLESVLASVELGVVVLDRHLHVMTWNPWARDLWGLREDEVSGKAFADLDIGLPVEELMKPITVCLREGAIGQDAIVDAVNRRGRPIRCRITCAPLHGRDRTTDGVILLMEEWTRNE